MTDKTNKPGWLILLCFAAFIIGFNIFAREQYSGRTVEFLSGTYLLGIGATFLLAYYFEKQSILFRGLIWICEHFSRPAGRRMAFFYAGLCGFLGALAILSGFGIINVSRHG